LINYRHYSSCSKPNNTAIEALVLGFHKRKVTEQTMVPPTHFGAYLSTIRELPFQEDQEIFNNSNQEAMDPLAFLPEVDSMPFLTPASRETIQRPFQATSSAEDLSILSGIAHEDDNTSIKLENSQTWSAKLKALLWSLGASTLATLSGAAAAAVDADESSINRSIAALDQWPSSDHLYSLNTDNNNQDEWENVEEAANETSILGFGPFHSHSFGIAEPPEPLLWDYIAPFFIVD
jgi:hypothetical protein